MESVVLSIAINLASTLLVAGGRRLGEEALGDEQEQALQNAFAGAMAAMLVEITRYAAFDRSLPGRLEEQFGTFLKIGGSPRPLWTVRFGPRRFRWMICVGDTRR